MKARIKQTSSGMYIGEVYGIWGNLLFGTERTGWNKVTSPCFTKFGAKLELKKWKQKHCSDDFEI